MSNRNTQSGFVLVVALIMLVALTGIAVALLVSSGVDTKMMSAAQESEEAINDAKGAHDEAFENEKGKRGGINQFTLRLPGGTTVPARESRANTNGVIGSYTAIPEPTTCQRKADPTSAFKCSYYTVVTSTNYGEAGQTIVIRSVVSQQLQ